MKKWLYLIGAIVAEAAATLSLRAAVEHPAWIALVAAGYITAFGLLGFALRAKMPIGVAYGIWGACGVAIIAVLGAVIFDELLSIPTIIGIVAIMAGVLVVETGAPKATENDA